VVLPSEGTGTVEDVILCRMCRKPDRQDEEEAVTISTELLVR